MNPLEILQKTPRTNCGQCGYPSCLAFSAAVSKTGEDPGKCPFINKEDLQAIAPAAESMEELGQERDLALVAHLKEKIANHDFKKVSLNLGATHLTDQPDTMMFKYLGQEILLSKNGITINSADPEDPRDQILLYNYVHQGGGQPLSGTWIGLESLPNAISKVKTLARYAEEPIADLFSNKPAELIIKQCEPLAPELVPENSASIALTFPVLPMIPLQVLFWEEDLDDGFPAKVKILFDEQVLSFLDIESLVFTAERLADKLAQIL
jgi:hypothetical protein